MKVYFTASVSGKKTYGKQYQAIVETLRNLGYDVHEHIIKTEPEQVQDQSDKERVAYYKRMVESVSKCDLCVAEVSTSSLGVGHEITIALEKGKPVIAFYQRTASPNVIRGISSDRFLTVAYEDSTLRETVRDSVEKARGKTDIRFNFFVSPEINEYLDWISRVKRVPRAVYLRELVEKEIERNKEYRKQ